MTHLRASCVFSLRNQLESDHLAALWALGANGLVIEDFIFLLLQPHELEALGAATDLR